MKRKKIPVKTDTIGLWGNGNGVYTSKLYRSTFLQQIGDNIRFCLVYNRQHKKDDNRPRFLLRIYNTEANKLDMLAASVELALHEGDVSQQEVVSIDDATDIAIRLCRSVSHGYSTDDVAVEAFGEMREQSFTAVSMQNIEEWENQ